MEAPTNYDNMRQWLVLAILGEEISAKEAAARLSRVEKAEQRGKPCPDIRSDFHLGFDAPSFDSEKVVTDGE